MSKFSAKMDEALNKAIQMPCRLEKQVYNLKKEKIITKIIYIKTFANVELSHTHEYPEIIDEKTKAHLICFCDINEEKIKELRDLLNSNIT